MLKGVISISFLMRKWITEGVTPSNTIFPSSLLELAVFVVPALIYLFKNLLQYFIFLYISAPQYQVLKNLNIISTGVLFRLMIGKK